MASPLLSATAQACVLSATSNILAQAITAYRQNKPLSLNITPIIHFVLLTIINCPPNVLWQRFLERNFPGYTSALDFSDEDVIGKGDDVGKPRLNVRNTMTKLLLDQTLGAGFNAVIFIVVIGFLRGETAPELIEAVQKDFWPVIFAGLKLWPLVSFICFTVVPVEKRILVASLAGVGWGVYLSLVAAET